MEQIIFVLSLVAVISCIEYNGLRARYSLTSALENDEYFFNIPLNISAAESDGWKLTERPPGPLPELTMYCAPGRVLCSLYANTSFVAGILIAIPVNELNFPLVKPEKNFVKWSPPAAEGENATEYWTTLELFVSKESLQAGTAPKVGGATLQDGAVWVQGSNSNLTRVPMKEAELNTTAYIKQNCIPGMGTHYHYNMTSDLKCEDTQPWFAVTTEGDLIATGFQWYGNLSEQSTRQWFEDIALPKLTVQVTIPFAPTCMGEWAEDYGVISLHIFYNNEPWNTQCKDADSAVPDVLKQLLIENITSSKR